MTVSSVLKIIMISLAVGSAHAYTITPQLVKSLNPKNDKNQMTILKEFSKNQIEYCKMWHPQAFIKNKNLNEACKFSSIFNLYIRSMSFLKHPNDRGVKLSPLVEVDESFVISSLQAGAWELMPFTEYDGVDTAIDIIISRIGIEKTLLAHARHIQSLDPEYLNSFASFNIPRLIASFSGYSLPVRILSYAKSFSCGSGKVTTKRDCIEAQKYLNEIQKDVLSNLDIQNFFSQLEELNDDNATTSNLVFARVIDSANAIQELRDSLTTQDILDTLTTSKKHPAYLKLKKSLSFILESPVSLENTNHHKMLIAISILAELKNLESTSLKLSSSEYRSTSETGKAVSEHMYLLKSWITKALTEEEQVL